MEENKGMKVYKILLAEFSTVVLYIPVLIRSTYFSVQYSM
jgi:hypothetical protein